MLIDNKILNVVFSKLDDGSCSLVVTEDDESIFSIKNILVGKEADMLYSVLTGSGTVKTIKGYVETDDESEVRPVSTLAAESVLKNNEEIDSWYKEVKESAEKFNEYVEAGILRAPKPDWDYRLSGADTLKPLGGDPFETVNHLFQDYKTE